MRKMIVGLSVILLLVWGVGMWTETAVSEPLVPYAIDTDDGVNEMGVEWDTDMGTRPHWEKSATGLYTWLQTAGWQGRFKYANSLTWEEDFKRAANGGTEHLYVDSVDLALIGTHGSSAWDSFWNLPLSSVWFSTSHDDQHLSPGEAYQAYGDGDLEWLAFDSCSVLRDDSLAYWSTTFNGLHQMLGFANTMYVNAPGDGTFWGYLMAPKPWCFNCPNLTVTQSWFIGTDWNQPSGVRARILAEEANNYNDYLWGAGYVSPDYAPDSDFWWWDHVSGTPEPLPLSGDISELPVFQIVPRTVNTTFVQNIGQSLGLNSDVFADPDEAFYWMTGSSISGGGSNLLLMVSRESGSYYYLDTNTLWHQEPQQLPANNDEALALSLTFLAQHDTLPGSFFFDSAITPTVAFEGQTMGVSSAANSTQAAALTQPMNVTVSYARTVTLPGGEKLSIVGPGSRQNVTIGGNNEVVGIKGGWREVSMVPGASVSVLSAADAWQLFLANPETAVAHLPYADTYELQTDPAPTLAYYEQPSTIGQAELIPVWVFVADLYVTPDGGSGQSLLVDDAKIYVPATAEATALPQAAIVSPTPNTIIMPGETVNLEGSSSGGVAPLSYEWFSSVDGFLGSGASLADVPLTANSKSGTPSANVITLIVTDANGLTASDSVVIDIPVPLVYAPVILK